MVLDIKKRRDAVLIQRSRTFIQILKFILSRCLLSGAGDWFVKYFTERGHNIPLYVLSFHRVIFQKFTKHDIFNTDTSRFIQPEISEAFYISDSFPRIQHKRFSCISMKVSTDHWKAYLRFKLKCQIVSDSQNFRKNLILNSDTVIEWNLYSSFLFMPNELSKESPLDISFMWRSQFSHTQTDIQ